MPNFSREILVISDYLPTGLTIEATIKHVSHWKQFPLDILYSFYYIYLHYLISSSPKVSQSGHESKLPPPQSH
jgi:hypothetical protein